MAVRMGIESGLLVGLIDLFSSCKVRKAKERVDVWSGGCHSGKACRKALVDDNYVEFCAFTYYGACKGDLGEWSLFSEGCGNSLVKVGYGKGDVKVCDRSPTRSSIGSEVEWELVEAARYELSFACDRDFLQYNSLYKLKVELVSKNICTSCIRNLLSSFIQL
jgi:hypothetical protein